MSVSVSFHPRDAMLARYLLSSCVRPSVRHSQAGSSYTKMAIRRITQTTPYDSNGTLVYWRQRSANWAKLQRGHPKGAPSRGGVSWKRRHSTNISLGPISQKKCMIGT